MAEKDIFVSGADEISSPHTDLRQTGSPGQEDAGLQGGENDTGGNKNVPWAGFLTEALADAMSRMGIKAAKPKGAAGPLLSRGTPGTFFSVSASDGFSIRRGQTLLETYRIDSDPSEGGMGAVWRVHHIGWNVDLAMKRPKPGFFTAQDQKDSFIRECRYWIDLGLHPNIVSCYYVREIGGIPTIFSQWMENGSLEERINDGTLYEGTEEEIQERLLDISIQFARGLRYAHENRLIHQDVKPDNLLLTGSWEAKVSDFGLSRAVAALSAVPPGHTFTRKEDNADSTMVTASGGMTRAYCSPEQAARRPLTRRTDIYSWAVSVMEMYLRAKPWAHPGQITGPLAGLACRDYFEMCIGHPVPGALKDLLENCMKQDQEDRPRSFAEVENLLTEIYRDVTGADYPRPEPRTAENTSDTLNNRALSCLDLGDQEEAEKLWSLALEKNPGHFPSIYNQSLHQWRKGLLDDEGVIQKCRFAEENSPESGLSARWRKQIDLERGLSSLNSLESVTLDTDCFLPAVCVSRDGTKVVAAGRRFRVWDVRSRKRIVDSIHDPFHTEILKLSEDGRYAFTFGSECAIRVVDVESGETIHKLALIRHSSAGTVHVRLFPKGRHLYVLTDNSIITVWEHETGRCKQILNTDADKICISPDEKFLYTIYNVYTHPGHIRNECVMIEKWDLGPGKKILSVSDDENRYHSIWTDLSGNTIFVYGTTSSPRRSFIASFKAKDLSILSLKETGCSPGSFDMLTADGRRAFSFERGYKEWSTSPWRCLRTYKADRNIRSWSIDASGSLMALALYQKNDYTLCTIKAWDISACRSVPAGWELSLISDYGLSRKEREIYTGLCRRMDHALENKDIPLALELSSKLLLKAKWGDESEYIPLFDMMRRYCRTCGLEKVSGKITFRFEDSLESISLFGKWSSIEAAALFETRYLAVGSEQNGIRIWDISEQKLYRSFGEKTGGMAFSPDGSLLSSGDEVWNIHTGKCLYRFYDTNVKTGRSPADSVIVRSDFCPDRRREWIVSACYDGRVFIWEMRTGKKIHTLRDAEGGDVKTLLFSPNGCYAACFIDNYRPPHEKKSGVEESFIEIYDAVRGRVLCRFSVSKSLYGIRWGSDGRTIIYGFLDKGKAGIRVISANDGELLDQFVENAYLLPGHSYAGRLCMSSDEKIAAFVIGTSIEIWDIVQHVKLQRLEAPDQVHGLSFSSDGTRLTAVCNGTVQVWWLLRKYDFPGWKQWDEAALPYYRSFLQMKPDLYGPEFEAFVRYLQNCDFGFLLPGYTRKVLEILRASSGS